MQWICSCHVRTKELLLKIAVLKRQTKSLKTTWDVVSFYYICKLYAWNFLKVIFSQAFLKDFAKIACDVPFYGKVKNLIINFAKAFRYFSHYQFIAPLSILSRFWSSFFLEHLPVVVSANTCLKVTHKNSSNFLK